VPTSRAASILLADPGSGFARYREQLVKAFKRVLESGQYVLGKEVAALEAEFARYIGSGNAVGVASGTDAIELALRATGADGSGIAVTVANSSVATAAAICRAGLQTCFVDIDESSLLMDLERLEAALQDLRSRRPAPEYLAVVVVHLYGAPVDMTRVAQLGARYDAVIIEDCAQAHGATWNSRRVGTFGSAGAFSFYPTKNLGGLGDGGMVVCDSDDVAQRVRELRQYGWREQQSSTVVASHSRLDELQAALLRVLLPHTDARNTGRREVAAVYSQRLEEITEIATPSNRPGHVYHQYVIQVDGRDDVRRSLEQELIATGVHYPIPIHLQPAYRRSERFGSLQRSEVAAGRVLSLPIGDHINAAAAHRVSEAVARATST